MEGKIGLVDQFIIALSVFLQEKNLKKKIFLFFVLSDILDKMRISEESEESEE